MPNNQQILNIEKQINDIDAQILSLRERKQKLVDRKDNMSEEIEYKKEKKKKYKVEDGEGGGVPAITTTSVGDAAVHGGQASFAPKLGMFKRYTQPNSKKKKSKKRKKTESVNRFIDSL